MTGMFRGKILPSLPERKVVTPAPKPVEAKPVEPVTRLYGIDVSHYQPAIDWNLVASMGKKFVFAKASDGLSDNPDSMFQKHRAGAKAAGLIFGSYHFYRPLKDPIHQADVLLKVTGGVLPGELPLTLDVEYSDGLQELGNHADNALKCLEKLEKETGMTPIIYTSFYFFQGFKNPERFARFIPWLAAYNSTGPKVPAPWSKYVFWQYSEKEKIKGVDAIDGNQFNGTMDDLRKLVRV